MDEASGVGRQAYARVNEAVRWSDELGARIVARVAAGASVRALAGEPGFPRPETVTRWAREKPEFAQAMRAAKDAAGSPFRGSVSTWCEATGLAIFERLCAGEGLIAICRDAAMPAPSTVHRWRMERPEFGRAIEMARDIQADAMVQQGWDWCAAARPQDAFLLKVKLGQLRWHAGKIAPKAFGAIKAADPEGAGGKVTNVYMRQYMIDPQGGEGRWGDAAPELVYSATAGKRGEAPSVVTGPASSEAKAPEREAFRRAFGEAGRAARAAGVAFNGSPPLPFWPAWYAQDWPDKWDQRKASQRHAAEGRVQAMAGHGKAAQADDLLTLGWTDAEAAERYPPQVRAAEGDPWL